VIDKPEGFSFVDRLCGHLNQPYNERTKTAFPRERILVTLSEPKCGPFVNIFNSLRRQEAGKNMVNFRFPKLHTRLRFASPAPDFEKGNER
jgi:hypothetical protein